MSLAEKALWVIERNSGRELTLGSIAAACKVSRSHLANAFGTASGWPLMAYLRAHRLSEAARRLAAGAPDILSVALWGKAKFAAFASQTFHKPLNFLTCTIHPLCLKVPQ